MRVRPAPVDTTTLIARLERTTAVVLAGLVAVTWPVWGWPVAGGVLGGGLLSAISYLPLKRGVERLGPPADAAPNRGSRSDLSSEGQPSPRRPASAARVVLGLATRYALLLAAGYVIIARLHLHPLGVLVGASAVVIAAMVEAVRSWR